MKRNVTVAIATLLASLYFIYFYIARNDIDAGSLGTLGDFIGGNLNPILTFITTILLIETLALQRKATIAAEKSAKDAEETVKQQGLLIRTQIFESSFFNLIDLCLEEYKTYRVHCAGVVYEGPRAFYFVEKQFALRKKDGENTFDIINDLDERYGDIFFNTVKSFASVFGFISDNAPEETKSRYISLAMRLTPVPAIYLLCIAKVHTDWSLIKEFDRAKIFEKKGVKDIVAGYR